MLLPECQPYKFACVSLICMRGIIHPNVSPPLNKPACTTAGKRNASLPHCQWQDGDDARLLGCIFNPEKSAPLLWIHHLQFAQVSQFVTSPLLRSLPLSSPQLPHNPFIVSPPSSPSSFTLQSTLLPSPTLSFASGQNRWSCSSQVSNGYVHSCHRASMKYAWG